MLELIRVWVLPVSLFLTVLPNSVLYWPLAIVKVPRHGNQASCWFECYSLDSFCMFVFVPIHNRCYGYFKLFWVLKSRHCKVLKWRNTVLNLPACFVFFQSSEFHLYSLSKNPNHEMQVASWPLIIDLSQFSASR